MKIIAAIDIMEGKVVRLFKGSPQDMVIYGNDPVEIAIQWEKGGADALHIVDLDAAFGRGNNQDIVFKIIDSIQIPCQIAGGLRSSEAINEIFRKKSAKAVIGTLAYKEPETIRQLAKKKAERIVISIDQKENIVMIDGWREKSGMNITAAISLFAEMKINEFLLTSIDRDGTMHGPDLSLLAQMCRSYPDMKFIASGGISSIIDVVKVKNAGCSSVILGKALYENKVTIASAKAVA